MKAIIDTPTSKEILILENLQAYKISKDKVKLILESGEKKEYDSFKYRIDILHTDADGSLTLVRRGVTYFA